MSTNTQETSADILRNRTPVRGRNAEMLPVEFENGHVVRIAEARRTPDHDLQHWAEFVRRCADYLQNLRCRRLLFPRIVQLATKPRDLSCTALWGFCPVASRLSRFAACSGAPSHRASQAYGLRRFQRRITAGNRDPRNRVEGSVCTAAILSRSCPLWFKSGHEHMSE